MGLDMYLHAKRYLYKYPEDGPDRIIAKEVALVADVPDDFEVSEITITAGYWRKANAIHKWFVDHVQNGTDDCGHYYVPREKLTELRDTCRRVLDFKYLAENQLPTQSGFFFGGTDYDDFYYNDVELTIQIIDKALELPEDWDLSYHSSW